MPNTTRPNTMSCEDAVRELSTLQGVQISYFSGNPEIVFTHQFAQALELARWALMQPERQETTCEVVDEPSTMTVNAQCMACGIPCSTSDNYCPHCGRRLKGVVENGCTKE